MTTAKPKKFAPTKAQKELLIAAIENAVDDETVKWWIELDEDELRTAKSLVRQELAELNGDFEYRLTPAGCQLADQLRARRDQKKEREQANKVES